MVVDDCGEFGGIAKYFILMMIRDDQIQTNPND